MILIKKRRHKPLYKKFFKLKTNVQNRSKLMKFKQLKWQRLISSLKKSPTRYYKTYTFYDHNKFNVSNFGSSFKTKYRYSLREKQKISLFYGGLLKNYLKKVVNLSYSRTKKKKNLINYNSLFFEIMESRLDTVLYRSHFVISFRQARQLISHGCIEVNSKVVTSKSFILKKGDVIKVTDKNYLFVKKTVTMSNFWPLPPKYLDINYNILQIIFFEDIQFTNFSFLYPFWVDLNSINSYLNF